MTKALALGLLTFLVAAPAGTLLVRWLRARGIGKRIRVDGPSSHQVKMGTPTMGGLLIVGATLLVTVLFNYDQPTWMWIPLGTMLAFGLLGALDDARGLTKDRNAPLASQIGLLARHMLIYQIIIALAIAALLYWVVGLQGVRIPGTETIARLGLGFIPIAAFVIVATANGINITDGLDGLAGGTSALAFAAYAALAYWAGESELAGLCLTIVGALGAFLWHNAHPAAVFMGGVGSLALGGTLAVVALLSQQWLLLPLIGLVFTGEVVGDLLQIGYFKYTRKRFGEGRRLFKMAPIHHHFELLGWSETQVTQRFWLVGAAAALAGLALALW